LFLVPGIHFLEELYFSTVCRGRDLAVSIKVTFKLPFLLPGVDSPKVESGDLGGFIIDLG